MSWRTERYATFFLQKTIFFKTIKAIENNFFKTIQDNNNRQLFVLISSTRILKVVRRGQSFMFIVNYSSIIF